jgi:starch-binding outer membrane protein SusE/F
MKKLNKILFLGLAFVFAWGGCKKEETQILLNPGAKLEAALSANTVVLLKDNAALDALTVSWIKPDFGFPAAATYNIFIDKKGSNFGKAVVISAGTDLKKTFKVLELNNILTGLGLVVGTAGDLEFRVECLIGASTKLVANIQNLKGTIYVDKLDLNSTWGVVGDATPGGWGTAGQITDLPMYKLLDDKGVAVANSLVAYVSLNAGQIKFRRNNDWGVNLGATGTVEPYLAPTGSLIANGKNIGVTKDMYKITIDTTALTYKIESFTLGIVGDATANSWGGPDQVMTYDPAVDLWRAVVKLTAGQIKFRVNNAWAVNFGAAGSVEPAPIGGAGTAVAGGKNFGVTAGTYLITFDMKTLKYTFEVHKPWGLVGDATPGGWNGPDLMFNVDLTDKDRKKWTLKNVVLTAAQVKFREDNGWTVNYGAPGTTEPAPISASGVLAAGGKNFGVTAGTWSFELDFTDSANPKYKATKK